MCCLYSLRSPRTLRWQPFHLEFQDVLNCIDKKQRYSFAGALGQVYWYISPFFGDALVAVS